jgi:hypothetical protein
MVSGFNIYHRKTQQVLSVDGAHLATLLCLSYRRNGRSGISGRHAMIAIPICMKDFNEKYCPGNLATNAVPDQ